MMRRLFVRRGFTALLGMAAASSVREASPVSIASEHCGPQLAGGDPENEQRSLWGQIFEKKRSDIWRRETALHQAWHSQHMDLLVLQSTSQSWRAGIMLSRIKKRQREMDTIDAKLKAIWQEPLSKLRDVVANWIQVN